MGEKAQLGEFTVPCQYHAEPTKGNLGNPSKLEKEHHEEADNNISNVGRVDENSCPVHGENSDVSADVSPEEEPCSIFCSYDDYGNLTKINLQMKKKPIMGMHGESRTYECPICGRYLHRTAVNDHILNHNELKFQCSEEGYMFKGFAEIKAHFVRKHDKIIGQVGKYGYMIEGEFREEDWVELKENPSSHKVRCDLCQRGFRGKKYLDAHTKNHTEMEYMYACLHEGCGFMYEAFLQLKGHCYFQHQTSLRMRNADVYKVGRGTAFAENFQR